jgi:hypothetical protein
MSCGLPDAALMILEKLYRDHCFARNEGYNFKIIEGKISEKTNCDFKKVVKQLKNEGYITSLDKKNIKYYISDYKKAVYALNSHNYSVTQGRTRKL